jgi:hypothetical protein
MTDILRRIGTSKRSVTRLVPVAFAGMLAIVVAADTASAETLEHLRTQLGNSKVPAGSIPGHPDQNIAKKPPPTAVPRPAQIDSPGIGGKPVPLHQEPYVPKSDDE